MANEEKTRSDFSKAWRIILFLFVSALPVQMMVMGVTRGGASVFFYIVFASALLLWWGVWRALIWRE